MVKRRQLLHHFVIEGLLWEGDDVEDSYVQMCQLSWDIRNF
ncbi:MAG: hypothetical protein AAGI69_17335 [Cyanobacteria bacterium P01_H01_bin.21]